MHILDNLETISIIAILNFVLASVLIGLYLSAIAIKM